MKDLTFISTPSHGYLRVPIEKFKSVMRNTDAGPGVNDITRYSGMDRNFIYLEEDCDASISIKAWENAVGTKPVIRDIHIERKSFPTHNYNPMGV